MGGVVQASLAEWPTYSLILRYDTSVTRDTVAKICGCGRKHSWIEWQDLPRVGFHVGVDETEASIATELRNCACGSTISAPIELTELVAFLTNPDLTARSDDPTPNDTLNEIRLRSRLYATAARTAIELLEEQRDEARRRERILQKKLIVSETRAADLHRTMLLRDLPKDDIE